MSWTYNPFTDSLDYYELANSVPAGSKFSLDGDTGETYLIYNTTTERVELWVKNTKQAEWGVISGGDPF